MNPCNYNLNTIIFGLLRTLEIDILPMCVIGEYGVEGFGIGSGIGNNVWFEREIGEKKEKKDFKYMSSTIHSNNSEGHSSDNETCYGCKFINKDRIIQILFDCKGWLTLTFVTII